MPQKIAGARAHAGRPEKRFYARRNWTHFGTTIHSKYRFSFMTGFVCGVKFIFDTAEEKYICKTVGPSGGSIMSQRNHLGWECFQLFIYF